MVFFLTSCLYSAIDMLLIDNLVRDAHSAVMMQTRR
jgi:hypothetical protein